MNVTPATRFIPKPFSSTSWGLYAFLASGGDCDHIPGPDGRCIKCKRKLT